MWAIGWQAGRAGVLEQELELRPHLFRRTFATLYNRETRDPKVTQLAAGYASVNVLICPYIERGQGTSRVVARFLF